ncbi:MAG: hypothetical protein HGA45_31525 [Chloroflexales bacterium]|nr:hypothetical protein [Chloroflexales bacterium]
MNSEGQIEQGGDGRPLTAMALLSQGQGDRFDRRVEFFSAIVLSLATVLTAWCGYQAARWSGEQARAYSQAGAARVQAAQQTNQVLLRGSIQVGLFTEYMTARFQGNEALASFYYERFPPELRVAADAWLASNPLEDPGAPRSPFDMPEYHLAQQDEALALEQAASQKATQADEANEQADRYVLLTVLFATVLFFGGISGKFQWRLIDLAMLVLSIGVLLSGLLLLLFLPVR